MPERPVDALHRVVRGYLDHLTVERGLSRNTVLSYRRDLERYRAALASTGVRDLAQVRPERITTHLATLRAGGDGQAPLSAASTARAASAIRGLHRFAAREGHAGVDASRDVRPALPPRRLPRALDVDQVERLLTAAGGLDPAGAPLAVRDRALLEFLYGTGARISEAVGAAVDDLDLTAAVVLLRGKGGRQRLVPVGRYAADALRAYLTRVRPALAAAGRGSPAIFLNARGGQLSRQSAWIVLRRAAERAGLPVDGTHAVSPHTLRHSYATHLLDGGADVRVVQELLGHASVTTTQVYTLVTVDRLREVYATSHPRARR
ncbi:MULTISPECIES: site-specific tyrosine recombinase XerD [unclassified Solwaraspora]|uniref:site-specific tyrosine recombinase XerD n=1 Tax=unclassified Solwaraspora TaxID=2627926 RepID=UPI00259B8E70|nr:site-specific tyrosine recombinase XerD [Solwaraspora sp. WMMA2056]WJK44051.1 site-specific tyrosine recombinase XerD [Solwaraspora sp. WMMA2056]